MSDTFIVSGTTAPGTNGTSRVVLEKNDDGEATKVISRTEPTELTKADQKVLAGLGVEVEKVTKEEAESIEKEAVTAPSDSALQGPSLGSSNPGNKPDSGSKSDSK